MRIFSVPLATAIAVVLTGCNDESERAIEPADIQFVPGQGSAQELTGEQRSVAQLAIDALAADLGIAKDRITVDTIRPVEWRDSSIGCPQPDRAYLQVVTPGHKITLRVDKQIHVVHEAADRAFVCHTSKSLAGITPQRELVFREQLLAARKDLATRLGVAENEIRPTSGEEATWDDASLGCPEQDVDYKPGPVSGWVLKLRYRSSDYTYHTDMTRTIPCPPITVD